jgi:hypothetical protein
MVPQQQIIMAGQSGCGVVVDVAKFPYKGCANGQQMQCNNALDWAAFVVLVPPPLYKDRTKIACTSMVIDLVMDVVSCATTSWSSSNMVFSSTFLTISQVQQAQKYWQV